MFFTALNSVASLFILILVGFVSSKTKLVSDKAQKDITNLVLYALLPATIIKAMTRTIEKEAIDNLIVMIAITFAAYIFMSIIAFFISRFYKIEGKQKDVLFCGMCFANITFVGLPVQEAIFGQEGIFYTILSQIVIFEVYCWSIGLSMLERHKNGGKFSFSFKNFIKKPGVVACSIGLVLLFFQIKLPKTLEQVIELLSRGTSPLAMITVGIMLSKSNIKKAVKNKYLYVSSFVKLLLIPISMILVLYLLNVKGLRMAIPVIEMAMPTAAYLAMLSGLADNDTSLASEQIFISSLLSLISIPIVVSILDILM